MRSTQRYLLAALAVLLPAHASVLQAQVADKKGLTLDSARRVITAAIGEAKKRNTTGVIAVVDEGGNTIALERLDNTFAAGANISIGKARTASSSSARPRSSRTSSGTGARRWSRSTTSRRSRAGCRSSWTVRSWAASA